MKKTILAAVPLALLALASPAAAHGGRHADTYTARLAPIAAPSAGAARHERDAEPTGVRGKATMVDGPRRDKVRLHVKGLTAGQAYRWEVREVSGDGACTGETVAEFTYGHLRARPGGGGSARGVSKTFAAEDGAAYAVVVSTADGTDVACGEFAGKAARKRARQERKAAEHGSGRHDRQGDDDEQSGEDEHEADADAGVTRYVEG